jgi:ubiquinone biosynthesis protein
MAVLAKYGFSEVANALRRRIKFRFGEQVAPLHVEEVAKNQTRPARVRMALEELGPTFIKLGQLLSTRPDLIPHEYIEELELLQDQVAPESFGVIKTEVEKELSAKLDTLFMKFEEEALAAGSIAQVHRATTKDAKSVVVKVRRPQIANIIRVECRILEDIAGLLKTTIFRNATTVDPQRMVGEFNKAISKEVDLTQERRNQVRVSQYFSKDPTIHVPQVYEEYSTNGVLTMEYIDGIKPSNIEAVNKAGLDPRLIATRGANFVLRQIFELGFFHADPHPGNFFLLPENVLAPLDFGQVARLSKKDRMLLNEMITAIVDNDPEQMIRALEQNDMTSEETDFGCLFRDTELMLETYHNLPLKEIAVNEVIIQTFDLIRRHYIYPPPQFTLMLKSLMTIESFAKTMDPDFEIIRHLKPYARRLSLRDVDPKEMLRNARKMMRGAGELASKLPEDFQSIVSKFRRGQFQMRVHHEHLESLVNTLDKSSNRISFALIIAALLIGSSLLVPQEGTVLGLFAYQTLGVIGYVAAATIGVWLIISIIRSRHY